MRLIDAHGRLEQGSGREESYAAAYEKTAYSCACAGDIEELHVILTDHLPGLQPIGLDALNRVYRAGTDEYALLKAYRAEVESSPEASSAVDAELHRAAQFTGQSCAVPVALTEDDGIRTGTLESVSGRILHLEVRPDRRDLAPLAAGPASPDAGLKAYWPLDGLPDAAGDIADSKGGYLLHLKRVRFREAAAGGSRNP